MGHADPFLLGTVGALMEMPSPRADGFDAPYERTQAVQRGLAGGTTVDMFGVHRAWQFRFTYRTDGEAAQLIARWTSPITTAKLRLVDPITPNRLSLDAASGGGVTGLPDTATATAGTVTRIAPDTMPGEVTGLLDGAYRWEPGAGAGALLLDDADRIPVQLGEAVTFRAWARGDTDVEPFVRRLLQDGTTTDSTSPTVALQTSTWTEITETLAVQAGTVAMSPGVKVATGTDGRFVELAAALFTADPDASDIWTPGGGAPVVVLTDFEHAYVRQGRREMSLTVREA